MTDAITVPGPPDSAALLRDRALRYRRGMLWTYAVVMMAWIAVSLVQMGAFGEPFAFMPHIDAGFAGTFGFVALAAYWIMFYGGGRVGPRPPGESRLPSAVVRSLRALEHRSLLRTVVRWIIPSLGFALLFGMFTVALSFAWLGITARLGGYGIHRDVAPGFLGFLDIMAYSFVGGSAAGLLIASLVRRSVSHARAMSRLVRVLWVAGLFSVSLYLVIAYISLFIQKRLDNNEIEYLHVSISLLLFASGTALRLLFIRAGESEPAPGESVSPTACAPVPGNSSLNSARNFATVLLVVCYVSFDVAVDHTGKMELLQQARKVFASHFVYFNPVDAQDEPQPLPVPLVGTVTHVVVKKSGLLGTSTLHFVQVVRLDESEWLAGTAPLASEEMPDAAMEAAVSIAARIGVDVKDNESFTDLFRRIESELVDRQGVTVPMLGLPVDAANAAWALSLLVLGLMVLIRSRVRRVFYDPDLAVDEPWLILDGRTGVERVAAWAWLALVLSAPWVTYATLSTTIAVQIPAAGGVSTIAGDALRLGGSLAVFAIAAWTSILTVADLLLLRELRGEQLHPPAVAA